MDMIIKLRDMKRRKLNTDCADFGVLILYMCWCKTLNVCNTVKTCCIICLAGFYNTQN
jgi:hypothetical protein